MSTDNSNLGNNPSGQDPQGQPPKNEPGTFSQEYRHQPISARVPERVSRGVMSTGVLVLDSPNEFVLDFMQGLTRPFQVVSRIVLTPTVMDQFVHAVRDNLSKYESRFGPPPALPRPPSDRRPTLQEIYDEFKVPDEIASGIYSNAVLVGHSPSEFFFDFITNFYPTSTVAARVFVSAAQLPRVLETISVAYQRYRERRSGGGGQMHPPQGPQPQGQGPQQMPPEPPAPPATPEEPPKPGEPGPNPAM